MQPSPPEAPVAAVPVPPLLFLRRLPVAPEVTCGSAAAMRMWAALRAAGTGPGAFRERFDFGGRDVASWFPRHMAKGLRQMRLALRRADCLVEVHDARIPLSGRNPALQEALGIRPHVLVMNKMDLADPRRQPAVLEQLRQQGCSHVVFTDCQRDVNVKKVVPMVARLVAEGPRYHRAESSEYNILVIGVPNVGKSSFINSLRRLHLKKGISAQCQGSGRRYVQHYGLGQPCDHIEALLKHVALTQGRTQKVKVLTGTGNVNMMMLNYPAAAYEFLRDFRAGRLGRVTLD
ncbi:mitochondrial ribosome-associated GTPase 1 isoform X2 [Sylvia atricapilla]|uniref:mitochondrial ribosome-associated GTPase 1 isoform X2 n=1 Tax=Sylvia atricapilla TaxID=48155 RepID=UPI00339AE313